MGKMCWQRAAVWHALLRSKAETTSARQVESGEGEHSLWMQKGNETICALLSAFANRDGTAVTGSFLSRLRELTRWRLSTDMARQIALARASATFHVVS
jgi:hypothetical protein